MPSETILQNELISEGNSFELFGIILSFKREISLIGEPVSGIHGGQAEIRMPIEFQTFSESFFADWFADPGARKDVTLKMRQPDSESTFLEVKMQQAAMTRYSMNRNPVEEASAEISFEFVSQHISIGQAPIEVTA